MGGYVLSMITYNSLRKLGSELFMRVWESSLQVPYDAIILIDDGDDGTRKFVGEFADKYNKELYVVGSGLYGGVSKPTRATARQTAIDIFLDNFSHDYLFFLDDDAVLNPGWWGEYQELVGVARRNNVAWGIAWGINWDSTPDRAMWLKALGIDYEQYLVDAFHRRGGEHDTIHPRNVLKEIRDVYGKIPPELHVYEDAWLYWATRCLGYADLIIRTGITHYNPWRFDLRREEERWIYAIRTAVMYGISEDLNIQRMVRKPVVVQALELVRPILGVPLALYINVKAYGLNYQSIRRALVRQYMKLLWRWLNLKARIKYRGVIPKTPCEGLALNRVG